MTTTVQPDVVQARAVGAAAERFAASNAVAEHFFGAHADAIAQACGAMAERFKLGGRLFVCGDGAQRSDVAHVVVEFVHPVIVGKRALPALPLPEIAGGAARRALHTLGRGGDLLMLLSSDGLDEAACDLLDAARTEALLTLALTGSLGAGAMHADHQFVVPSSDPCIVQETHEMLYHVLWELVHVFFEHGGART